MVIVMTNGRATLDILSTFSWSRKPRIDLSSSCSSREEVHPPDPIGRDLVCMNESSLVISMVRVKGELDLENFKITSIGM